MLYTLILVNANITTVQAGCFLFFCDNYHHYHYRHHHLHHKKLKHGRIKKVIIVKKIIHEKVIVIKPKKNGVEEKYQSPTPSPPQQQPPIFW